MNYEDLVSKAQGPKNTFVGKNGSVQLLNEEEFMHSKLYYIQGDPKQKGIFETDRTWPKNNFLGAN